MTIKDMEARSGLSRANIRFYEQEGMLAPARLSNGYRDYSERDMETLCRIKLLRELGVSLEEIKAAQSGERSLAQILEIRLGAIEKERAGLECARRVCERMKEDGAVYSTLNAEKYLDEMAKGTPQPRPVFSQDREPQLWIPWRRFFARMFDLFLCSAVWISFCALVLRVNFISGSPAARVLGLSLWPLLIMLLLEPVFLSLFGVTPGKLIFGIRVISNFGRRLSYKEGLARTARAVWWGMGFYVPVFRLVRLIKSYHAYSEEKTLSWEYDSELTAKDKQNSRCLAMAGAYLLVFAGLFFSLSLSAAPLHRGDITLEQFCKNYNSYLDYYGFAFQYRLDSQGAWVEVPDEPGMVVIYLGGEPEGPAMPKISYTEENSTLKSVVMELSLKNGGDDVFPSDCSIDRELFVRSFVLAQKDAGLWGNGAKEIFRRIRETPLENFRLSAYGVEVDCQISYTGYHSSVQGGILIPGEGERSFSLRFSMTKTD